MATNNFKLDFRPTTYVMNCVVARVDRVAVHVYISKCPIPWDPIAWMRFMGIMLVDQQS